MTAPKSDVVLRELDPDRDAETVVELIHEMVPYAVTTVESWRQARRVEYLREASAAETASSARPEAPGM